MKKIINKISDQIDDLETRWFFVFFLLCKIRFRFYSQKQIKNYQHNKINDLINFAINNSGFFKDHYHNFDLNNFHSLPTVNKKIMMDNLTSYNTVGLSKEEILDFCLQTERTRDFTKRLKGFNIGMSSGTSGNKGVEIVSRREESYMKAALFARFDFPKKEKINIAFILRVSSPAFNLNSLGYKLTYINQLQSIKEVSKELHNLNPNILSAPASTLRLLAKEVESNRLDINPKRVVSYAEVLYPDVKKYLEKIFGCKIHEIYKCTEGPIAITCKLGKIHINEDLVYVETLNNNGTPTLPGRHCQKLVITDLHKRSQPIIRYELNDIISISKNKCLCGSNFRVIKNIQGRADDIFLARDLKYKRLQYIFPDYISRAVISSSEKIDEYQVIQKSLEEILIRIQLRPEFIEGGFEKKVLINNFKDLYNKFHCVRPKINIRFEKPEVNMNSHKLIRIHRNFEINENEPKQTFKN